MRNGPCRSMDQSNTLASEECLDTRHAPMSEELAASLQLAKERAERQAEEVQDDLWWRY